MTLIDPRTPEEKAKDDAPKEVLSAKVALQRALSLKTFKLMVSRPVRKRVEGIAPICVESAQGVLSEVAEELFQELHCWIVRGTNTTIVYNYVSYPKNWRQHLKMAIYDALPADIANWAHGQWPIEMTKEEVPFEQNIHVCPHTSFPASSEKHVKFIAENFDAHDQLLNALRSLVMAVDNITREMLADFILEEIDRAKKLLEDKAAARGVRETFA